MRDKIDDSYNTASGPTASGSLSGRTKHMFTGWHLCVAGCTSFKLWCVNCHEN